MYTLQVDVTREQHDLVEQLVRSGRFADADDVMRAALRLLEEREIARPLLVARLRAALDGARRGQRADGSGELAVRRAFERARRAP